MFDVTQWRFLYCLKRHRGQVWGQVWPWLRQHVHIDHVDEAAASLTAEQVVAKRWLVELM